MLDDLRRLAQRGQSARSAAIGLGILFFVSVFLITAHDTLRPHKSMLAGAGGDFRAFYCGGRVLLDRANPYLVEPLRSCENRVQPLPPLAEHVVDPAPLPGYALALFALLALLPYAAAKALWFVALLGSVFAGAWFLSQLTRFPALAVLLGLSLIDGYISLVYGQLPPLLMAGVAGAAYFVECRKFAWAAVFATLAMIEPHVGAVAALSMFLWLPRTRVPLAIAAAVLGAVSLLATGINGNIHYFTQVLPGQATAELVAVDQWSLSHQLHRLGFSDALALRLGALSYLVLACVGILLARRAAIATESDSLIVALPAAAVLLGGSFLHEIQLAAALPAAFILAARAGRWRVAAAVSAMLLIFPWFSFSDTRAVLAAETAVLALCACVWLAVLSAGARPARYRGMLAAAVVAGFFILFLSFRHLPGPDLNAADGALPARVIAGDAAAPDNWGAYLRSVPEYSVPSLQKELEKIPSWFALALLLVVAAAQRPRKAEATVAVRPPRRDAARAGA